MARSIRAQKGARRHLPCILYQRWHPQQHIAPRYGVRISERSLGSALNLLCAVACHYGVVGVDGSTTWRRDGVRLPGHCRATYSMGPVMIAYTEPLIPALPRSCRLVCMPKCRAPLLTPVQVHYLVYLIGWAIKRPITYTVGGEGENTEIGSQGQPVHARLLTAAAMPQEVWTYDILQVYVKTNSQ